jgi:quinoprotein glucose dehydrogenase
MRLVIGTFVAVAAAATVHGQHPSTSLGAGNWMHSGGDPGATKFSTLDQINTTNVHNLQRVWTFHTGDKSGFFESTPLVIDSVMYTSAQNGVFALDAVSGQQLWKFETSGSTRRGVAYWPGDAATPGRIIVSSQSRLLALDAKTGRLVPGFGEGGFVEMNAQMQSPPSVFNDVLITPQTTPVIKAWNAKTGKPLWTFHLIAQPGDPNHATWESDVWKTIGGTNTWGYLTVDVERGIVYIPVSIAGSDYVGVQRPGNNLYGTSLVAVDIATGTRKWHQQLVHHDIWDYDLGAAPTLIDVVRNGKTIPAVAQINKMGLLFIFDRVTGEPIFGIEERPVPQSTVPGEKTSPTQPFPVKPAPLARNSLKRSELPKSISPELFAYCEGLWDKYKLEDSVPYTPWGLNKDVVVFPGAIGGGNWNGVAFNKPLGLIFTNVMNAGQWGHIEAVKPGEERGRGGRGGRPGGPDGPPQAGAAPAAAPPAAAARPPGGPPQGAPPPGVGRGGEPDDQAAPGFRKVTPEGGRFWQPDTRYSCNEPPWGELIAVNANTGDIAWRVPLGVFPELEKKGLKTGTPSLGGAITTAGNLVFIAATIDGYFRAFDARNGKELWSTKLDVPAHAMPSTYMGRDGKQYVVITDGGGGFLRSPTSDAVIAFRLP